MNRLSRLTPAVLALALLSATPALPQSHRGTASHTISFGEVVRGLLPDFVVRLWWGDSGCSADPFGGSCRPATAPATTRLPLTSERGALGCEIDPYGTACRRADAGCDIDPFGRCK
jgi:hypothetical protein